LALAAAVIAAACLLAGQVHASTYTWSGSGIGAGSIFDSDANWGGVMPSGSFADTAYFNNTTPGNLALVYVGTTAVTNNPFGIEMFLDSTQTGSLAITATAAVSTGLRLDNITVNAGAGALSFGVGGSAYPITIGGSGNTAETWTNNSSNAVVFGSAATIADGNSAARTVTLAGAGGFTFNGVMGGNITFAQTNSSSIITITGANTLTGGVSLSAGLLNINSATAIGTGRLTIGGGTIDNSTAGAITGTAAATETWNGDFTFKGTQNLKIATGAITLGGAGSTRTVNVSAGSLQVGFITTAGMNGYGLTKTGPGVLSFGGSASGNGTTNIDGPVTISAGTLATGNGDMFLYDGINAPGATLINGSPNDKWLFVNSPYTSTLGAIQFGPGAGGLKLHKSGAGTLTLTGSNQFSTAVFQAGLTIRGGAVVFGDGTAPAIGQSMVSLYYDTPSDSTLQSTLGTGGGTSSLTFGSIQTRAAGATMNFVVSGGVNGNNNDILFTTIAAGFVNQGAFFGGSDYAYLNTANGYVRAPIYGSDAGFIQQGSSGALLTTGSHNLVNSTISGQTSVSVNTIKLDTSAGAVDIGNAGSTLTLTNGGLLATGGGAASISGGTLTPGAELVMRTVTANDSLTISSVITGANAITKSGPGSATLTGANTFTGAVYVDGGALSLTNNNTYAGNSTIVAGSFNINGVTVNNNAGVLTVGGDGQTARMNLTGAAVYTTTAASFTGGYAGSGNASVGVISVGAGSTLNLGAVTNGGGNLGGGFVSAGALYNFGNVNNLGAVSGGAGFFLGNNFNAYGYLLNSGGSTAISGRLALGNASGGEGVTDVSGGTVTVLGTNQAANATLAINFNGAGVTNSLAALNIINGGTLVYSKSQEILVNQGTGQYASINVSGAGSVLNVGPASGFRLGNNNTTTDTATLSVYNGGTIATQWINQFGAASATGILSLNGGLVRAMARDGNGLIQGHQLTAVYVEPSGGTIDNNGFGTGAAPVLVTGAMQAPNANGTSTFGVTGVNLGGTLTGYIGAPVVKFTGGGGQGAAGYANFDPITGTITGITVTSPGSGYTSAPTITLVGGSGSMGVGAAASTATATATIGAVASGGLTYNGVGVTAVVNSNTFSTYAGGTTVNNGTLMNVLTGSVSGNISPFGTGPITLNNATLRLGNTPGIYNDSEFDFPNAVTVNGSTIYSEDASNHIKGTVNVTANGGTLGSTYNAGNATEASKGLWLDGAVSGSGSLTVRQSGINTGNTYNTSFVVFANNANSYSGTITVVPMGAGNGGGSYLGVNGSNALALATVNLPGNNISSNQQFGFSPLVFNTGLGSATLGALTGSGSVVLTGYDEVNHQYGADSIALTVGGNNATTTYSGGISGGGSLAKTGAGVLYLTGTSSYSGGTTVNGGTLNVNSDSALGYGFSVMTFTNNSTLQFGANNIVLSGGRSIVVNSGVTATFDTAGNAVTIQGPISDATSGGGLTKTGAGVLSLNGGNSYTGNTTINAGTLLVNGNAGGSLGTTNVSAGSNGVLAAAGYTNIGGNVTTTASGAAINLQNGTVDTLNVAGGLNLHTGTALDFDLGSFVGSNDVIAVQGAVSQAPSNTVNIAAISGVSPGNYTLLSSSGGIVAADYTLGSRPSIRGSYSFNQSTSTALVLTISANATPSTAYWTGSGSRAAGDAQNRWAAGPSAITNWSTDPNGTADAGQVPGTNTNVYFTATNAVPGAGGVLTTQLDANYAIQGLTIAVPTTTGSAQVTSTVINPSGFSLTIGSNGLTLDSESLASATIGAGSVVLGTTNQSWANNNSSLGLTVNAAIAPLATEDTTTLTLNGFGTGGVALNGTLSDSTGSPLALVFNQAGVTQLSGSNSFTGGVTISGGTVQLGNAGALNTANPNAVTFGSGSFSSTGDLRLNNNSVAISGLNFWDNSLPQAVVENGGASPVTLTLNTAANNTFNGVLQNGGAGSLALAKAGTGSLFLTGTNTYTGGTSINGGVLNFMTGSLPLSGLAFGGGTLQWASGNTQDVSAAVLPIPSGVAAGIDLNGNSVSFASTLTGSGGLSVGGAGYLTLTNSNRYTGTTSITSGTVQVDVGGSTATLGAGNIVLGAAGTLIFDRSDSYTLNSSISGAGALYQIGNGTLTLAASTDAAGFVNIGANTGNAAVLNLSSGTLTTSGQLWLSSASGAKGTMNMSGGLVNVGSWLAVGRGGDGGLANISGGSLNVATNNLTIASFAGNSGTLNISGGSVHAVNAIYIGESGNGTMNLTGAGLASASKLWVGLNSGAAGAYTQNGGTLTTSSDLIIGHIGTGSFSLSNTGLVSVAGSVYDGDFSGGLGSYQQTGGSYSIGGAFRIGQSVGSDGTFNMSGGSMTALSMLVGVAGTGAYTQSGGVETITSTTFNATNGVGTVVGSGTGSVGTLNISGGTITGAGPLMIWGGTGSVTISQTGSTPTFVNPGWITLGQLSGAVGTITQNSGTVATHTDNLYFGWGAGAQGTYILHGGSLAANDIRNDSGTGTFYQDGGVATGAQWLRLGMGTSAIGSYTLAGGSVTMNGADANVGENGAGTLSIGGSNGGSMFLSSATTLTVANGTGSGVLNLQPGGLLRTQEIRAGAGSAQFNFSGGTLQNAVSGNLSVQMPVNLTGPGTVDIDAGQAGVVTPQAPISGSGSLLTTGGGTLTLSGTNSYTGITEVLGGTLVLTSPSGIADGNDLYVGTAGAFFAPVVPAPVVGAGAAVTAVPEPGTLALLATGGVAAVVAIWRRRRITRR
jgi:autotransporter-associated beta strand protein